MLVGPSWVSEFVGVASREVTRRRTSWCGNFNNNSSKLTLCCKRCQERNCFVRYSARGFSSVVLSKSRMPWFASERSLTSKSKNNKKMFKREKHEVIQTVSNSNNTTTNDGEKESLSDLQKMIKIISEYPPTDNPKLWVPQMKVYKPAGQLEAEAELKARELEEIQQQTYSSSTSFPLSSSSSSIVAPSDTKREFSEFFKTMNWFLSKNLINTGGSFVTPDHTNSYLQDIISRKDLKKPDDYVVYLIDLHSRLPRSARGIQSFNTLLKLCLDLDYREAFRTLLENMTFSGIEINLESWEVQLLFYGKMHDFESMQALHRDMKRSGYGLYLRLNVWKSLMLGTLSYDNKSIQTHGAQVEFEPVSLSKMEIFNMKFDRRLSTLDLVMKMYDLSMGYDEETVEILVKVLSQFGKLEEAKKIAMMELEHRRNVGKQSNNNYDRTKVFCVSSRNQNGQREFWKEKGLSMKLLEILTTGGVRLHHTPEQLIQFTRRYIKVWSSDQSPVLTPTLLKNLLGSLRNRKSTRLQEAAAMILVVHVQNTDTQTARILLELAWAEIRRKMVNLKRVNASHPSLVATRRAEYVNWIEEWFDELGYKIYHESGVWKIRPRRGLRKHNMTFWIACGVGIGERIPPPFPPDSNVYCEEEQKEQETRGKRKK